MRVRRLSGLALVIAAPLVAAPGCGSDDATTTSTSTTTAPTGTGGAGGATTTAAGGAGGATTTAAGGAGGAGGDVGKAPPAELERFCAGKTWSETLTAARMNPLSGEFVGSLQGADPSHPMKKQDFETMKVIPDHPFRLETIRVAFAKGSGKARLRVMPTFGRTYPAAWPKRTDTSHDLIPPVEIDVKDADPETWIEVDVSAAGAFLLPTQHYMIVYEHVQQEPLLALEKVPDGEFSRGLLFPTFTTEAYGLQDAKGQSYNYRLELGGHTFCPWSDAERLFGEDTQQPWTTIGSARVAVSDLNGDGHDDVIVNDGNPAAYFGDGKGHFASPPFDPFPDAKASPMLVFSDLDNDGDVDAFAARYVSEDGDGDTFGVTDAIRDCNDADPAVHPGAPEVTNGYDDDCDGVADDGTDTSDADKDGVTIAAGDCDDTRADVHPGAPELADARDNDCDGFVDEDFVNLILKNDGAGHFSAVASSGVEAIDPTTAAAFGDADGDGKLDLYYGNWLRHYPDDAAVQDRYFTGNGDLTFTDSMAAAGLVLPTPYSVYGVEWTDYNNDGFQDIYVGNYHLYDNQLWENQGDGTFKDVAVAKGVAHDDVKSSYPQYPGGHTYGTAFGDFDNDGDVDAYICNLAHPRTQPWGDPSMFVVNQGPPAFTFLNQRDAFGFIYDEGDVNAAWGDYDNDGDLDLAIASLYTGHYSRLYRNDGKAGFVDVTYETHTEVHDSVSVVWADVDEDGDLDLLAADRAGAPFVHLFVNRDKGEGGYVELDLRGTKTNRDAVGARVTLKAGGVTMMRDVTGGGGQSNVQAPHMLHFGLGKAQAIDEVTVHWVGGATETITGVVPKQRMRIVEGSGKAVKL